MPNQYRWFMILKPSFIAVLVLLYVLFLASIILNYHGFIAILRSIPAVVGLTSDVNTLVTMPEFRFVQGLVVCWILVMHLLIRSLGNFLRRGDKIQFDWNLKKLSFLWHSGSWLILVVPMMAAVYFAIRLPVVHDEAWNYNHLISKGFLTSFATYPAPNNHILHSVIALSFQKIPGLSVLFKMRLPALLYFFLSQLVILYSCRKHFNIQTAILVSAVSCGFFMSLYYGFFSRGYGLTLLFFVMSVHLALNIAAGEKGRRNLVMLILALTGGILTMPSFLYAAIIIGVFILCVKKEAFRSLLMVAGGTGLLSVTAYTPVLIIAGYEAITRNKFVAPIERRAVLQGLYNYFEGMCRDLTGIKMPLFVYLILIVVSLSWLWFKQRKVFWLASCSVILPPILLIAHSVIPFSRTFSYLALVFAFLMVLPFYKFISNARMPVVITMAIVLQIVLVWNFNTKIWGLESPAIGSKQVFDYVRNTDNIKLCSRLGEEYLYFNKVNSGVSRPTIFLMPAIPTSADTLLINEYVVIDRMLDSTQSTNPILKNNFYRIYRRTE